MALHSDASGHLAADQVVLQLRDLRVSYRSRGIRLSNRNALPTVAGVSITLGAGEIVGLVGESGSGKSTIALAAGRLIPTSGGSIEVLGSDVTTIRGRALRQLRVDMQAVFQDPLGSLDPRKSVGSGFRELRRLHPARTRDLTDTQVLDRVGLHPEILNRLPHEISGGQAQRVCIARALLVHPKVLIADEPTSALDVSVQAQILELLKSLRDSEGIAILFISHDLSLIRSVCDRIYVLRQGTVVEQGMTERVLMDPQAAYTRELIAAIPGKRRLDARGLIEGPGPSVYPARSSQEESVREGTSW